MELLLKMIPTGRLREVLTSECDRTPDSSRFWPAPVRVGEEQPSFDKQHIRDYLKARGLGGKPDVSHPHGSITAPRTRLS